MSKKPEYDAKIEKWVVEHDIYPITVKQKSLSEAEAMLEALARRHETIRTNTGAEL